MKRSLGLVAALVLSTSFATVAVGSAEAQTTKVLSKTELRHALLTARDLPDGFRLHKSAGTRSGSGDEDGFLSTDPACEALNDSAGPVRTPGKVAGVAADFIRKRDFTYEAATVGISAFRSPAAVAHDLTGSVPILRACHKVGLDMGDGTTLWLKVETRTERIDGNRTIVIAMRGRYLGVLMNTAMAVSQVRSCEVLSMVVGANKSSAAVRQLNETVLHAQAEKLTQHLR